MAARVSEQPLDQGWWTILPGMPSAAFAVYALAASAAHAQRPDLRVL